MAALSRDWGSKALRILRTCSVEIALIGVGCLCTAIVALFFCLTVSREVARVGLGGILLCTICLWLRLLQRCEGAALRCWIASCGLLILSMLCGSIAIGVLGGLVFCGIVALIIRLMIWLARRNTFLAVCELSAFSLSISLLLWEPRESLVLLGFGAIGFCALVALTLTMGIRLLVRGSVYALHWRGPTLLIMLLLEGCVIWQATRFGMDRVSIEKETDFSPDFSMWIGTADSARAADIYARLLNEKRRTPDASWGGTFLAIEFMCLVALGMVTWMWQAFPARERRVNRQSG